MEKKEDIVESFADNVIDPIIEGRLNFLDKNLEELKSDFKTWKSLMIGVVIGVAALLIAFGAYFANNIQNGLTNISNQIMIYQSSMATQMQTFADYVKVVTSQTHSQIPQTQQPAIPKNSTNTKKAIN